MKRATALTMAFLALAALLVAVGCEAWPAASLESEATYATYQPDGVTTATLATSHIYIACPAPWVPGETKVSAGPDGGEAGQDKDTLGKISAYGAGIFSGKAF